MLTASQQTSISQSGSYVVKVRAATPGLPAYGYVAFLANGMRVLDNGHVFFA